LRLRVRQSHRYRLSTLPQDGWKIHHQPSKLAVAGLVVYVGSVLASKESHPGFTAYTKLSEQCFVWHYFRKMVMVYLAFEMTTDDVSFFKVQNLAFSKVVAVYWAAGNAFQSTPISASYSSSGASGYEVWSFSGQAAGATQFYIKYTVLGSTYVLRRNHSYSIRSEV